MAVCAGDTPSARDFQRSAWLWYAGNGRKTNHELYTSQRKPSRCA